MPINATLALELADNGPRATARVWVDGVLAFEGEPIEIPVRVRF